MSVCSIYPQIVLRAVALVWKFASTVGLADEGNSLRYSFSLAVRQHDSMIKRICFGYAQTTEDLEDLYQDVLVNLWQSMGRFRGDASMKTWIYRIALNTCVSNLRSRSKTPKGVPVTDVVEVEDESYMQRTEIKELHECIAALGALDKAIMMLWLDEYSYDEIASMVGISRNNVATRLHRAKEKLKTIYGNGK